MPDVYLPSRLESAISTKTPYQRHLDNLRRTVDLDWAPRAGCQPRNLAMACEKCVYGTGKHRADCVTHGFALPVLYPNAGVRIKAE